MTGENVWLPFDEAPKSPLDLDDCGPELDFRNGHTGDTCSGFWSENNEAWLDSGRPWGYESREYCQPLKFTPTHFRHST